MKKTLTLLLLVASMQLFAQSYPITGVTISLPANPDANTANWGSGVSMLTIMAATKLNYGKIDGTVLDSKIVVTIKKGGAKICGTYTSISAPTAGFNTVAKVWSGKNAVSLLGQDCVLPPGEYEICVQFFGYSLAVAAAPLSEEKCKRFTIKANEQQTYQPPQAITPANGTTLTEAEAKKPITVRWIPVIPKPQEPVTYRVKVWQLMQGQNGVQAMKANQPIIEQDVDNLTQTVINNLITGPCLPPYLCDFVWNVQALNREGKPIGGNDGKSGTNQFSLSTSSCSHTADIISIECIGYINGTPQYKVCVDYKNTALPGCSNCIILLNSPNNYGGGQIILSTSPSTVINTILPTVPTNLTSGQQTTICFNATVTPGNHLKFQMHGTCNDASISLPETDRNHENSIFDTLPKPCVCNPCKDKVTIFGNAASSALTYQNSGSVDISSTVTHAPVKVIKVSAEIVDVERLGEAGCLRCTKESREFGNFTGGSLNNNAGTIVNGVNGYGKQIQWQSNTPILINNFNYDLQMMFPPLTEVSCCKDSIRICTRWSFTDEKCVTCDTLICTIITREYKIKIPTGPVIISSVAYAAQVAKMGEPFISWYKQDSNELPGDFNRQIDLLRQKNKLDENELKPEYYENGMKQSFLSIRSLKKSSLSSLWLAIQNNTLNGMCDNGDFEDGLLHFNQWSAGYGTILSTNNPILGNYIAGFLASDPGLNTSISTGASCNQNSGAVMVNQLSETHQTIVSYANDPVVGSLLKTTSSTTNAYSLRIGNSCISNGSEYVSKQFVVSGTGIIRFMYALVMNGWHGITVNPSFCVKVFDASGTPINNVVYLNPLNTSPVDQIVSSSTDPFFQHFNDFNYKDWTCATIKLDAYIGQVVSVALITTDCSGGAHFGYAYIDDWCGNCGNATTGSVNIAAIADPCIKQGTQICVDYTLPKIGAVTGSGTVKLQFYQNGSPIVYSITSPTLTASGTYCFTIDPSQLPCTNGQAGYDVVATGNFSITPVGGSSIPVIVTSPDPVGNFQGITTGFNNDLVCCSTPADNCCNGFVKMVTTQVSMVGTTTAGYNTIKFVPTFIAGPKPIKQIRISVVNFESSSSNKECLSCETSTVRYGTMSVPQNILGGGKDAIEGMVYPSKPLTATCFGCPPNWNALPSSEVTWGSESGPGYDLTAGSGGDQTTTFSISLPKKSTLSCCDDTIKVCIKYSFTDVDCKTCDTIICYKVVNRTTISTLTSQNSLSTPGNNRGKRILNINDVQGDNNLWKFKTYSTQNSPSPFKKGGNLNITSFSNYLWQRKKGEPHSNLNVIKNQFQIKIS